MSTPQRNGWWPALLALPVLCCVGHTVLVVVGAGSLTSVLGGATGSVALVVTGLLLILGGLAWRARRRART